MAMAEHIKDSLLHGTCNQVTHASDSRWRHHESHSFAAHARNVSRSRGASTQPSSFYPSDDDDKNGFAARKQQKTALKNPSLTIDLADFLNSSRVEPLSDGFAKGRHTPLLVGGSHGEEFAEKAAARSSDGHRLQEEVAPLLGKGFGRKVRCGPLLNYRRMETNIWYGSVLIVVKNGETAEKQKVPILEWWSDSNRDLLHEDSSSNSARPTKSFASHDSNDQFATPRTSAFTCFNNDFSPRFSPNFSPNSSTSHLAGPGPGNLNTAGSQSAGTVHTPAHDSLREFTCAGGFDGTNFNVKVVKVEGTKLYSDLVNVFFRFDLQVPMVATEQKISYTIVDLDFSGDTKKAGSQHFYVPAKTESMRIMFHSCNGFSVGTDEEAWSGPALWNDVVRVHEKTHFHVMIGGGDQIYNDGIRVQGPLRKWTDVKNPIRRREYPFTEILRRECDEYYSNNYIKWYSTEPFASANGQIPQLNIWDDHDIIDGFGSYISEFMHCPVFRGIGGVAYKYYMLFQHHLAPPPYSYTTDAPQTMSYEAVGADPKQLIDTFVYKEKIEEPSYIIGAKPGPYVAERSRSIYARLGARIAFLGIDARTERTRHQVNYPETYDLIFKRLRKEFAAAASTASPMKHLLVLLGIPIAYPRLTWLETIFTSPVMGPIKFMNKRFGLAGGLFNHFDGSVDLLDDLDDHYTAKAHKRERQMLVERFQALAAEFSVRVTILGGDVHIAAVGRFYSNLRLGIPIIGDHRYMANVISSAIVNKPPPAAIANLLARRNKLHHLNNETDETLLKLFDKDPGPGQLTASSNHVTMPSRNWAMITENSGDSKENPSLDNTAEAPCFNGDGGPVLNRTRPQTGHVNGSTAVDGNGDRPATSATSTSRIGRRQKRIPSSIRVDGVTRSGSNITSICKDGHFPLHSGEEGAGTLHRAAGANHGMAGDGSLDVMIRVEIDQHDKEGKTVAYGLQIPRLEYKSTMPPLIMRNSVVLVEHKQISGHKDAVPPQPTVTSAGSMTDGVVSSGGGRLPTMRSATPNGSTFENTGPTTNRQSEKDGHQAMGINCTHGSAINDTINVTEPEDGSGAQHLMHERQPHLFGTSVSP